MALKAFLTILLWFYLPVIIGTLIALIIALPLLARRLSQRKKSSLASHEGQDHITS